VKLKKLFLLAAAFLMGSAAFAEIALKDAGNGQVTITFTYQDDKASEMDVIGSFDNWTAPGEAMTKNPAGLWEKAITAASTDEITYKFYSKGTWITDEKAPDLKDDGYGGHNGLIVVADILSGAVPAVPGAAPAPVVAGVKKPAGRPKIFFGTQTFVESDTNANTASGGFDTQNSVLTAYSEWKFRGDLIAGMPGHIDITAIKGAPALYTKGTATDLGTGSQNLAQGFLFAPFYYLSANQRPSIDKFGFGIESPWLVYDTGYGNTPFPVHQSILWQTSASSLTAGNGYSAFTLGKDLKDWGDVQVDAGIIPNASTGNFGLTSWATVDAFGVKVEGQYDLFTSATTDASQYFTQPNQQNYILGAEAYLDAFFIQGQYLVSTYPEGSSAASYAAKDRTSYKAVVGYRDSYGDAEFKLGFASRGVASKLVFANAADNTLILGKVNVARNETSTQAITFDGFQKFEYWGQVKLDGSLVAKVGGPTNNLATTVRPGLVLNLDKLNLAPVETEVFAQVVSNTKPADGIAKLAVDRAGAKLAFGELVPGAVKGVDLYYEVQTVHTATSINETAFTNATLNSLLSETHLAGDVFAQAGFGYRTGDGVVGSTAFVLGARYKVPVVEAMTPTLFAQVVYNMDPFNAAHGPTSAADSKAASLSAAYEGAATHPVADYTPGVYDLTDFGPTSGPSALDGQAAVRVGISWNY
jgi:hypothetical protein